MRKQTRLRKAHHPLHSLLVSKRGGVLQECVLLGPAVHLFDRAYAVTTMRTPPRVVDEVGHLFVRQALVRGAILLPKVRVGLLPYLLGRESTLVSRRILNPLVHLSRAILEGATGCYLGSGRARCDVALGRMGVDHLYSAITVDSETALAVLGAVGFATVRDVLLPWVLEGVLQAQPRDRLSRVPMIPTIDEVGSRQWGGSCSSRAGGGRGLPIVDGRDSLHLGLRFHIEPVVLKSFAQD